MAPVVFLALGVLIVQAQGTSTYVAPNSLTHCIPCPAGTYVTKHCTEALTNSTCAQCPSGHYSDTPNSETYCKVCKAHCPKSGTVTQKCTASTNLECRCIDGYHKYPIDHIDPHWTCRKHTACKEGEGEVFRGNHTHDTKCETCKENEQFVNKSDTNHPVCQTCTTCAPGIREVKKCSLDHDRECDESQNGTYADVTSTVPSVTTTADQPSGADSGAEIAGIVCGVLVLVGIIAGAGLYILTKRNNRFQITMGEKIAVLLGILTGFGLLVVIIVLIRARQRGRGSSEQTYPAVTLANGSAIDATVGDPAPLLDWSLDFIEGQVFPYLSTSLGNEWRMLIIELPGWRPANATAVVEQSRLDERFVRDQIFTSLMAWKQQCTQNVTRCNILRALEAPSVRRMDLKQLLETMSTTSG